MGGKSLAAGLFAVALLTFAGAKDARAQAWAGEKSQLDLSFETSYQFSSAVFWGGDIGKITGLDANSTRFTLGGEYTPIENLTLGGRFTFQLDQYTGPQTGANPNIVLNHGENDDGDKHFNVGDANLEARYQVLNEYEHPLALSPVLRVKVPMSNYPNQGYAATGNGLIEVGAGVYLGKVGLIHDRIFAQGGYTFTWVQKDDSGGDATEEFSMHHSDVLIQAGYIITNELIAAIGLDTRITHGGFELVDYPTSVEPLRSNHDAVLSRDYAAINLAANYRFTDSLAATLAFGRVLWGVNVSQANTFLLSLNWTNYFL